MPAFMRGGGVLQGRLNNPEFAGKLNIEHERFGYPLVRLAQVGPKTEGGIVTENANRDHKEVVYAYINAGADPNISDSRWGNTPLMWSIANATTESALHFIDHPDVRIGVTDRFSKTPLHLAILKGYSHTTNDPLRTSAKPMGDVTDALLARAEKDSKFVINARDIYGNTPLHYAVLHRDGDLIRKLRIAGADCAIYNNDGKMPIDFVNIEYNDAVRIIADKASVFTLKSRDQWADYSSLNGIKDILNHAAIDGGLPSLRTGIGIQNQSTGAVETQLRKQVSSLHGGNAKLNER